MKRKKSQPATVLDDRELTLIDAYWRAANYLSVGQIYLMVNPLLPTSCRRSGSGSRTGVTGSTCPWPRIDSA